MKLDPLSEWTSKKTVLLAPVGIRALDVFDQMQISTFHATAHHVLNDLYFDTAKLDLIRFGSIVRYRGSAPRKFWNLQLFTRKGTNFEIHADLEYDGLSSEIPEQLVGLLYAFHRAQPLMQIGQIRAIEQSYELCDSDGRVIQRVVDVDMTSSGALWEAKRIRMFVIENRTDTEKMRRRLHAFVSAAQKLGARSSNLSPEIVLMLGPSLPPSFQILNADLSSGSSAYLIFQRAIALSTLRLLRFDPQIRLKMAPEMVHEFRVGVRRLRSDLRSYSEVIRAAETSALRAELSWLGGEIGKVRDCDVILSHVLALSRHSMNEDRVTFQVLRSALEDLCQSHRNALLTVLDSKRYSNLIGEIISIASGRSSIEKMTDLRDDTSASRSGKRDVAKIVRRRWRKYAKAANEITPESSDLDLHRVRILAKRCRYAVDSAVPMFGDPAKTFSKTLAEVQDLLGRYHDCVVQETWLREFAKGLPEARIVIGELILLMHQEQDQLRSEWPQLLVRTSKPKLRKWMENS